MPDPTLNVLVTAMAVAAIIFFVPTIYRLARKAMAKPSAPIDTPAEVFTPYEPVSAEASHPDNPYLASGPHPANSPPSLPKGKVGTYFYHNLDLIGIMVVAGFFCILVVGNLMVKGDKEIQLSADVLVQSIIMQFTIASVVIGLMAFRVNILTWLGVRWRDWPSIFWIAPVSVVGMWMVFGGLYAAGYMEWIQSLGLDTTQDTVKLLQESNDPLVLGLMAFAAVVAAPLCEEIVFRGYLYGAAKKFSGMWPAIISSAIIFSAVHGSLAAFLPLFIFGALLALLYEWTGSIWAPIAAHLLFNGATVAIQLSIKFAGTPIQT